MWGDGFWYSLGDFGNMLHKKLDKQVDSFYQNEELIALTRELTETLRKNRTIDWNRRDSARANMRRIVKRMLRKYHYPPEDAEGAMETVLHQCEQWAENNDVDQEAGPTRVFID